MNGHLIIIRFRESRTFPDENNIAVALVSALFIIKQFFLGNSSAFDCDIATIFSKLNLIPKLAEHTKFLYHS